MILSLGIDFGTSNSGAAIFDGRQVRLLPLDPKSPTPGVIKTILYVTKDFKHTIGQDAVELYYRHNIGRLRHFVKKWVGDIDYYGGDMHYVRDVYTFVDELQPGRLLQFLKTALRSPGYRGTQIFDRYYRTADLVAVYLQALRERAEALIGQPVRSATLGRPVQFSPIPEQDRQAETTLREAALQAGFKQVNFELEPVAAALYYEQSLTRPQNVLIFDFGGGTLDITILRLGDPRRREIFANGGIGIAGSDFDRAIIQTQMLPHFGLGIVQHQPELLELIHAVSDWISLPELSTPQAKHRLESAIQQGVAPVRLKALEALIFNDLAFSFYTQVEAAKIALSTQGAAVIRMEEKNLNLWELLTRVEFEQDIAEHRAQIEQVLLDTVRASGLEPAQIDAVVKTGGSSSIPCFTALLEKHFDAARVQSSDAFSSVTAGLAIRAYLS
jgi:hypothetical chaperone protein